MIENIASCISTVLLFEQRKVADIQLAVDLGTIKELNVILNDVKVQNN